ISDLRLVLVTISLFFLHDTATNYIYTLSLHDALPISEEMRSLFVVWLEDGTLEEIINHDVLGNKADQSELDKTNELLALTGGIYLGFEPFKINVNEEITDTINQAIEHAHTNKIPKVIIPEGHYYVDVVE